MTDRTSRADATGAGLIAAERQRQIMDEGYTAEHDAHHVGYELAQAATSILDQLRGVEQQFVVVCTWDDKPYPLSGDPVRDLTKAGALIAAEIDRLSQGTDARHSTGTQGGEL